MKTVLFDFDGTIADSIPLILEIINDILRVYGYPEIEKEMLSKMRNKSIPTILKDSKVPTVFLPFMFLHGKMIFRKRRKTIKPIKGIKEAISFLMNKDYKIGIVTSNSKSSVDAFLNDNNFPPIDYLYTSINLFGKSKLIEKCLHQHMIEKKEVVYVGDELRDITASRKIGIKVISVAWGFNSENSLKGLNPDAIIINPSDLSAKIEEML